MLSNSKSIQRFSVLVVLYIISRTFSWSIVPSFQWLHRITVHCMRVLCYIYAPADTVLTHAVSRAQTDRHTKWLNDHFQDVSLQSKWIASVTAIVYDSHGCESCESQAVTNIICGWVQHRFSRFFYFFSIWFYLGKHSTMQH